MEFTSPGFLIFLAAAAVLFRLCPSRFGPAFLLLASCTFYFTFDPALAALILAVTGIIYFAALRIEGSDGESVPPLLVMGVGGLVAYLSLFKIAQALRLGHVLIPLGISYYVFKLISYLIDVYWKTIPAERNFLRLAAFVSFFPQIVAGPIQRAETFLPQAKELRKPGADFVTLGIVRILIGFLKKLVVADNLAVFVNYGFAHTQTASGVPNWIGFYIFPLQLYADFAGLSDIAIGAGLLFGIRGPENFDRPFFGVNISEFWRRWHMSLTNWLKDYVFTPLRMALRNWGNFGLAVSLSVNMILIGLWHGFTLAFLIFGVLNAVYIVADALTAQSRRRYYKRHPRADRFTSLAGPVLTYHLIALAAVFARAASFAQGVHLLSGLMRWPAALGGVLREMLAFPNHYAWIGFPALVLAELLDSLRRTWFENRSLTQSPRPFRWSVYATAIITSAFLVLALLARRSDANPFFYAMF